MLDGEVYSLPVIVESVDGKTMIPFNFLTELGYDYEIDVDNIIVEIYE